MRRLLFVLVTLIGSAVAANISAHRATARTAAAAAVAARQALFERSQLAAAREQARAALRVNRRDVEALFIEMEAASLEADAPAAIDAALRLCELPGAAQFDDRVAIAAARLRDLAGNTQEFQGAIPRIQSILRARHAQSDYLYGALVGAAMDGAPRLNARQIAHKAGLATGWRIAGPFGAYPNLDFDKRWSPEEDGLALPMSGNRAVEDLQFDDGQFRLPTYFSREGVLYAAADMDIPVPGDWEIRAQSSGTLEVFVDGASMVRKDDRFRVTPSFVTRKLRLNRARHRLLVKFLAPAAPFRIAIVPAEEHPALSRNIEYAPEAAYIAAERKYWDGDYAGVISALRQPHARTSAITEFLLYRAWTGLAEDSPEGPSCLNASLRLAPEALQSEYELAWRAYVSERNSEALTRIQRVLDVRQNFAPAQRLMGLLAIRMHWPVRGASALEIYIALHPSCDALREAQRFFTGHARYDQAHRLTRELENCAPDSLAYSRALSGEGHHVEAAAAAASVVENFPKDRDARELLARELALAGDAGGSRTALHELAALAPNSTRYAEMATRADHDIDSLLDVSPGAADAADPFYSSFRRDGRDMVQRTADRRFSGGPAVVLVDDQVASLGRDGHVSLYVHKLTRVLDRDGVEHYGEVELPRGAEILELRTIKADGGIAEPEATQDKATISMPALLPGDAIDEEYVVHYPEAGGIAAHRTAFRHTFGSFRAPILYSRFAVITPAGGTELVQSNGVSDPRTTESSGVVSRIWEKDDIAQSVEEISSAKGDLLPSVEIKSKLPEGWDDVRRYYENVIIDATRIGPRVERAAVRIPSGDEETRARALYHSIVTGIRPLPGTFGDDTPSAEDTLAVGAGSRTAALLAIARAAGLHADLMLARAAGDALSEGGVPRPSSAAYTRPLVRFSVRDRNRELREIIVDPETDGLAFGTLPPSIERADALAIPLAPGDFREAPITQLPSGAATDQSVARGDVTLDSEGNLQAGITIVLGAWRGAQMRSILAGIEFGQRAHFYAQLAARIFPGAEDVTGSTRNEGDPDHPLEISMRCRVLGFISLAPGTADIDQLVPTLGLKKMFISGSIRQFPLFLDTPLIESATFRLHLPAGVSITRVANGAQIATDFGKYSVAFRRIDPQTWEIRRSFQIPVQVIPATRFAEFAQFAARIDDLERQRITLGRETPPAAAPGQ